MYAIANEKGVTENGEMVYEIFGVKLKTLRDMRETLESLKLIQLLENECSLLNKILAENKRETVIRSITKGSKAIRDAYLISFWPGNIETDDKIFQYKIFSSLLDKSYLPSVMDLFSKYFDTPDSQFNTIHVKAELYNILKVFGALDCDIIRYTTPYITYGKPYSDISNGVGNLSIARKNALALMTLTGKTYFVENDIQKPLIINGIERVMKDWEEVPSESKLKTLVVRK